MNNTKWEEVRLAMYALNPSPRWRTKDVASGDESRWDGEWFYHFRLGGYESIEWAEIETTSLAQRDAVLEALREIHVPGIQTEVGVRVVGYAKPGTPVEYL